MKIMYTRQDGGLSIITAASKDQIKASLGKEISDIEYRDIVLSSIPKDAINPREVSDDGIPQSREFRDAWVDVTAEPVVDIDLNKAKQVKLAQVRAERQERLERLDKHVIRAFEQGVQEDIDIIKAEKQALRDVTEPLKAMVVEDISQLRGINVDVLLALENGKADEE